MARLLAKSGVGRLVIANRTVDKAQKLADELDGEAVPLSEMKQHMARADLVVGAVTASEPIIGLDALPEDATWPSFFLDLAHPRNFEAEISSLQGVRVFDLDHVFEKVEAAREERARQVPQAEAIVEDETEGFLQWLRSRENVSVLKAVRSQVLELAQSVAERHSQGRSEAEQEEMRMLARSLARTLLHPPTMALREADPDSAEGRWLLESATTLFGVGGPNGNGDSASSSR
jgi:glutamyl-tRNA reductase